MLSWLVPSPTHYGGLPTEHPHHRAAAGALRGGIPGVQHFPPPDERARRAVTALVGSHQGLLAEIPHLVA